MAIISLEHISKEYKNEKKIFDNYDLEIEKGEFVGLVGKSGAGKTTLLNMIGLITSTSGGKINIAGKKGLTPTSRAAMMLRRNTIGYLFQNYGLIEDETVEWNLLLALEYKKLKKQEKQAKIQALLHQFGLDGYEKKYVYQLSGGEQQRIAIIKLILQESSIILADEPTSGLDKTNARLVMEHLTRLNKAGTTIVMVTHDLDLCEYFSRVIEVNKTGA